MPISAIAQRKPAVSELLSGDTFGRLYVRRRQTCARHSRAPERLVIAGGPAVTLVSKMRARKGCAELGEGTTKVSKGYRKEGMWLESSYASSTSPRGQLIFLKL